MKAVSCVWMCRISPSGEWRTSSAASEGGLKLSDTRIALCGAHLKYNTSVVTAPTLNVAYQLKKKKKKNESQKDTVGRNHGDNTFPPHSSNNQAKTHFSKSYSLQTQGNGGSLTLSYHAETVFLSAVFSPISLKKEPALPTPLYSQNCSQGNLDHQKVCFFPIMA